MERYRLTATKNLPEGVHLNILVAKVKAGGYYVSGLLAGDTVDVDSIEHPERLEEACRRGDLTMEKIGPAPKAGKSATGD